jgi:uncharacterized membrane protein
MVPLIELRAAIPYGLALAATYDLSPFLIYAVAIVGNCLPVPFILFFIRGILSWMQRSRIKLFRNVSSWVLRRGERGTKKLTKEDALTDESDVAKPSRGALALAVALFFFVAIPLPGTGAWSGSLIAALLNMKKQYSIPAVFLGVLTAGVIMSLITGGVLSGLSFLL